MKAIFTILKRELKSYFASPIAYIILVVFLVLSGIFFFFYLESFIRSQFDPRFQLFREKLNLNEFVIRPYFGTTSVVLLFMIPLITMRLIAEERKNFTAELLFTSPVRVSQIVFGKFLASLSLRSWWLSPQSIWLFLESMEIRTWVLCSPHIWGFSF